MTPTSYPLAWPAFRGRTPKAKQRDGSFKSQNRLITIQAAADRLEDEIDRLGGKNLIISSNIRPTLSGRPSANAGQPDDPGVAVYFQMGGDPVTLACDTFGSVAQNMAGLAGHVEATRRIERYGVQSAKETLKAFMALAGPGKRSWRDVLGLTGEVSAVDVRQRRRELAAKHHPDQAGSAERMAEIKAACDDALKELGA